jgi:TonB-dependent receptor
LPGIAIDRDSGEGRKITVRGLGSDFTRVRINGLEALATIGEPDSGALPNRSRGFDFNTFASDLFSSLQVRKTASANTDEGSLGATVDLITARPFEYESNRFALSAQDAYYENGGKHNPRVAGLMSQKWFDNKLGASVSFAYSERKDEIDRYRRQPGRGDYLYSSNFNGLTGANARGGFAAPTGTTFGTQVTNPTAIAALTGSDPAAYAALFPGAPYSTPGRFDNSYVLVPALQNLEQQNLEQERLGITASIQWRPFTKTLVNLDGLFSKFEQASEVNQIVNIGFNRNGTSAGFNTASPTLTPLQRATLYPLCAPRAQTAFVPGTDCGGTEARPGGVFAGYGTTSFSTNPNNLSPYDYYNNPASPGYGGAAAVAATNGMYFLDALIGRPSTEVVDAHVDDRGTVDYLAVRNLDLRAAADTSYFTTKFQQVNLNVQQEITDTLSVDVLYGKSSSRNDNSAFLVEFNRADSQGTYVYDERAHGSMPMISYGFDVADPNSWQLVKGFSVLRHFERETDNEYAAGHLNFTWQPLDAFGLEFGWTRRDYDFLTNEARRAGGAAETLNPTLAELGVTSSDLGRVYQYGTGLDVPAGTPRAFFAPDIDKFRRVIGFDCNCVNKWGDWRISYFNSPGNQFGVEEIDNSYFVQMNWNVDVFERQFFGNIGVRYAQTDVDSTGYTISGTSGPRPIKGGNKYNDTLPALNAAYRIMPDVYIRLAAAKVMARPLLNNLAPTISQLTTPAAPSGNGSIGSLVIGNPKVNPFRATNYDLSVEWYFAPGALVSAAYFFKDVSNYPQTVASAGTIQSLLSPEAFQGFLETQSPQQIEWLTGTGTAAGNGPGIYSIKNFQDAPGGEIKGFELSYQQNLTFLPGLFKNLGVQANYTKLDSQLAYIIDPGSTTAPVSPQLTQDGPFLGASPKSANFTVYYDTEQWSARVSLAYRDGYVTTYPIASGSCAPGAILPSGVVCNTALQNDFIGSKSTKNVDANFTYNLNENFVLSLEALNLTNQADERWVYQNDPLSAQYSNTGRQYFAGFRFQY